MMNKHALERRYNQLWSGEAVSAVVFTGLLLWFAYQDGMWQHWIARTYSLGVVILILGQAIIWWRLKLRLLKRDQRQMPAPILDSYRRWRQINWWLIGLFPLVVVLASQLTNHPVASLDTGLGLAFLLGAVLEQMNYYYYQLMYDSAYDITYLRTHRRLRRGTIAKALDARIGG